MIVIFLWGLCGLVALYLVTPLWMRRADPVGFALCHFLAIVSGPSLFLGLIFAPQTADDKRRDAEIRDQEK